MGFWEKLEAIPSQYRWAMMIGILALLGTGYWYFSYRPQAAEIATLDKQIAAKRRTLVQYRKIAAKYATLKAKLEELEEELRVALVRLPKKKEIPDLIRQISDLGVRTGLQINLLRPQPEKPQEFYAEVPIMLMVTGAYHATGQFFDALGRLPRIVSVSNVRMAGNAKAATLETQCLATTFRFFEDGEGGPPKGKQVKKQGRKR